MANKKALNDEEVQAYKMEKEEPLGTSKWGTRLIWWSILIFIVLIICGYVVIKTLFMNN